MGPPPSPPASTPSSEEPPLPSVTKATAAVGWILFALAVFVVLILVFTNEQFKRSQQLGSQGADEPMSRMLMNAVPNMTSADSSGIEIEEVDTARS